MSPDILPLHQNSMHIATFLSGIVMATFFIAAIFFFKFWKASRNKFYILFSIACMMLAVERIALLLVRGAQTAAVDTETASASWVYLFRLTAFVLIAVAIYVKNRQALTNRKECDK